MTSFIVKGWSSVKCFESSLRKWEEGCTVYVSFLIIPRITIAAVSKLLSKICNLKFQCEFLLKYTKTFGGNMAQEIFYLKFDKYLN